MTIAADWQGRVGDVWAAEWHRTDRSLADLSRSLDAAVLAGAPPGPGVVLDVGCGAGATSAALAIERPDLSITGIDLSAALIAVARTRAPAVTFCVGDAATDALGQAAVDLIVSRHGVMFFADPVAAFARLHAVAAPGGGLVFSCFGARNDNVFAGPLIEALTGAATVDPAGYAPGPFAFARESRVATILSGAGWRDARAERVDFAYVAGEGADPIADAVSFLSRVGPLASIVAADPVRHRPRLAAALARYVVETRVILPASAWIWRATKEAA